MKLTHRILTCLGLASFLLLAACGPEDLSPGGPDPITDDPPPLTELCTAESCEGCCDPTTNKCVMTRTADACGPNGSTCSKCTTGMMCHPSKQQCYTPTIRTKIQPLRAQIAPLDPSDNSDWDVDGSPPDVVIQLSCPNTPAAVPPSEEVESFTPTWTKGSCDVLSTDLLSAPIQFTVIDVDAIFDDPIASAQYQMTRADIDRGVVELTGSSALLSVAFQVTTYYAE
ncbi:hypothetical protein ASNO1_67160 [Corallococcus caeni]|uniref:Uncharacterized protein n=2 Tax=Corallococcus caeni TaxID=3082388 RepID=A0ABQ6R311_9BACT|nr:hypothetical protein ASNO1_67160 [Corallococcus sp. NO1]